MSFAGTENRFLVVLVVPILVAIVEVHVPRVVSVTRVLGRRPVVVGVKIKNKFFTLAIRRTARRWRKYMSVKGNLLGLLLK